MIGRTLTGQRIYYTLNNVNKTLSARLEFLLSDLGIKQKDFARKIDFTQSYVSMILSGSKTSPSPRFFEAVSREFSVNSRWLRTGSGAVYFVPGSKYPSPDAELIAKYRLLPVQERAIIDEIVNVFLLKSMGGQGPGPRKGRASPPEKRKISPKKGKRRGG
jgi:transcriptional regulator with XRE-family HTH domain